MVRENSSIKRSMVQLPRAIRPMAVRRLACRYESERSSLASIPRTWAARPPSMSVSRSPDRYSLSLHRLGSQSLAQVFDRDAPKLRFQFPAIALGFRFLHVDKRPKSQSRTAKHSGKTGCRSTCSRNRATVRFWLMLLRSISVAAHMEATADGLAATSQGIDL